jgi:hypothetical protein
METTSWSPPEPLQYESIRKDLQEVRFVTFAPPEDEDDVYYYREDEVPLRLELHTFPLADAPEYAALSYVWGDPSDTLAEDIFVDGKSCAVTPNLSAALHEIRKFCEEHRWRDDDFPRYLWVDAVCINQADTAEKSHQVALMGEIYSGAEEVISWVGRETEGIGAAFDLIDEWATAVENAIGCGGRRDWYVSNEIDPRGTVDSILEEVGHFQGSTMSFDIDPSGDIEAQLRQILERPNPFDRSRFECLHEFLTLPYWTRAWIMQEVILATNGRLLSGSRVLPLSSLWAALAGLAAAAHHVELGGDGFIAELMARLEHFHVKGMVECHRTERLEERPGRLYVGESYPCGEVLDVLDITLVSDRTRPITLTEVLPRTRTLQCTDARDKVFAFLSLVGEEERLMEPDYELDCYEVYARLVAREIERSQSLETLTWAGTGYPSRGPRTTYLPSWVADMSVTWADCVEYKLLYACGPYSARTTISGGGKILCAKGILCGKISRGRAVNISRTDYSDGYATSAWECVEFVMGNVDAVRGDGKPGGRSWLESVFRTVTGTRGAWDRDSVEFFCGEVLKGGEEWEGDGVYKKLGNVLSQEGNGTNSEVMQAMGLDVRMTSRRRREEVSRYLTEYLIEILSRRGIDEAPGGVRVSSSASKKGTRAFVLLGKETTDQRYLFISSEGHVGFAPTGSRVGDDVCVLLGCRMPLIIRPMGEEGKWELVGWADVNEMMGGEVVRGVLDEDGSGESRNLQDVVLV